jgi:hypothetical protein
MSALTEHECHDCLTDNLRKAIQGCNDLAFFPARGATYFNMIDQLEQIEGAARQVGHFRRDMRWQAFGYEMHRFRVRIGDALRSHVSRQAFLHMAKMMEGALEEVSKLRHAATGRIGPILPKEKRAPHRETRPVGFTPSPGGVLLPA